MLHVLVPEDSVFLTKFRRLEEPLLHELHYYYRAELDPHEARAMGDAYDSWGRILLKLPPWLRWQERQEGDPRTGQAPDGRQEGYVLHNPRGRQLTCLYAIETDTADLDRLAAGHRMLTEAEQDGHTPLARALADLPGRTENLLDDFRRVMEVLLLPPPRQLLESLRHTVPAGPVVAVTLSAAQEAEYRDFCARLVHILSSGDRFAYVTHRAMYF